MIIVPDDDETRWILGRPNFWCAPIAANLRKIGHGSKFEVCYGPIYNFSIAGK